MNVLEVLNRVLPGGNQTAYFRCHTCNRKIRMKNQPARCHFCSGKEFTYVPTRLERWQDAWGRKWKV